MTTVGRADTCYVIVRPVGVGGVVGVVVLRDDVILTLSFGQMELSFSVSHPQAQFVAAQTAEHHTVVLWNLQTEEGTLELMRIVVQHLDI